MAAIAVEVRHRKGCGAKGKEPRGCSCAPAVRVQVNRAWQSDLAGELKKGWRKSDLAELEVEARRRALDHDSGRRLVERGAAPTLAELAEEFLADIKRDEKLGDYSPNTTKTYHSLWRALLEPALGDRRVTDITQAVVSDLRAEWAQKGHSRNYVMSASSLLSTILADKAMPKWISANPCASGGRRGGRRAASRPARQPRALPMEFVFALLDGSQSHSHGLLHDMILCAVTTGMRQREVAGLRPEYVHFRERRIEVAGQLHGSRKYEPTKSGDERETVLCDSLADRLQLRVARCRERGYEYVFAGERFGEPWSPRNMNEALNNAWEAVGPRQKGEAWHALRHTFASILDRNRVRPLAIDAVMGHKNQGVSFRYRHVLDDELDVIVDVLNREFDRTPPNVTRLSDRRAS
jgi:integrase